MQALPAYLANVASGRVSEVNLSMRRLGDSDMPQIVAALQGAGSMVKVLDLEQNNFTSQGLVVLCKFLHTNSSIREVNLNENKINDLGAEKVLELLSQNHTITAFSLADNEVSEEVLDKINYAAAIQQPSALKKMLSRNVGSSSAGFSDQVLADPVLDLSNSAGKLSLQLLAQALKDNEEIESLSLANCGLGDPGLEVIAEVICGRKRLRHLDLSRNGISTHGCKLLADLLRTNGSIQSLVLANNKIADDAARSLIDMMTPNDTITALDVADNAVTETVLGQLNRAVDLNRQPTDLKWARLAMQNDDPRVTAVELQWHKGTERAGHFLGPVLRFSTHVAVLVLSNAGMGCEGAKELSAGLRLNRCLQRLELANNLIKDEGGLAVAEAVRRHPTLTELNLANNLLGNPTGRALVDVLGLNDLLTAVNVELNDIDDVLMTDVDGLVTVNRQPLGIKRALHSIETDDPALTELDFSTFDGARYHTAESAKILCIALARNTHVKYLDLSNNNIGDLGAEHVAEYVLQTASLEVLKLNNVTLSDRGATALINALRANEVTRIVEMVQNPLTDISGKALLSLLITNTSLTSIGVDKTRLSEDVRREIETNARINCEPLALKGAIFNLRAQLAEKTRVLDLSAKADDSKKATDETVRFLCAEALGDASVQVLNLSNTLVAQAGIEEVAALLRHPSGRIEELVLASCARVDDACAAVLAGAIQQNTTLKVLDLRATAVGSPGVLALAEALKDNNVVTSILVNRDKLSSAAVAVLSRELALNTQVFALKAVLPRLYSNDAALTAIALRGGADRAFDDLSCQLLALALQHNHTITAIDLSHNDITTAGVEYLVDMLADNRTLLSINLNHNRIDDDGGRMLVKRLESNDAILNIDLDGNMVSPQVLAELSYMLGINNGPLSLKSVMVAISGNDPSVTEVDFNGLHQGARPFDDEAVHILCSLLVENTHVRAIDLANNQITDTGAALIADLLRENATLETLFLENNRLTRNGGEVLFQTLKANHTLHTLNLDGNAVPPSVLENIGSVLNVNKQPLKELKRIRQRDFMALDDHTQFRDVDYMADKADEILEDALVGCPREALPRAIKMREFH